MKSSLTPIPPERIRELLRIYYEGDSTAAAEDELIRYFTTASTVAAEFEVDAAIFRAMADSRAKFGNVPLDLEERILDATVNHRSNKCIVWIFRVVSMAAMLALLIGVGIRIYHEEPQPAVSPIHTPYEIIAGVEKSVVPDTEAQPIVEQTVESPAKLISHAKQSERAVVEKQVDNYYVVTDTAQAIKIADRVLDILGASLETGAKGIRKADVAAVNFDRTVESIYMSYR